MDERNADVETEWITRDGGTDVGNVTDGRVVPLSLHLLLSREVPSVSLSFLLCGWGRDLTFMIERRR